MQPLRALAAAREATVDAAAIAAALANPWVDVVLSGAVTVDQLRSNLRALELGPSVDWPMMAEAPESYWERRRALEWG